MGFSFQHLESASSIGVWGCLHVCTCHNQLNVVFLICTSVNHDGRRTNDELHALICYRTHHYSCDPSPQGLVHNGL